jgi:hypothetical protein
MRVVMEVINMTTIPRFKIVWAGTPNQTKGIAIVVGGLPGQKKRPPGSFLAVKF